MENVYDELNEDAYSDRVQKRLEDDWIVDDGIALLCIVWRCDSFIAELFLNE